MSTLESYTQVGLWDRRREAAIQASKKEKKTSIHCHTDPALWKRRYCNVKAAQLCERFPKILTWERPRGRLKGSGVTKPSKHAWMLTRDIPEGIRF